MKTTKSLQLKQFSNPKYLKEGSSEVQLAEYVYQVKSFKNILCVHVGQWLYPSEVQKLIDDSVDVSIT